MDVVHGAVAVPRITGGDGDTPTLVAALAQVAATPYGLPMLLPPGRASIDARLFLKSRTRLIGSGVGITTLRIKDAPGGERFPSILSVGTLGVLTEHLEIAHLSLDGNLQGYANAPAGYARGAIAFGYQSRHVHLHDLEIVNAKNGGIWASAGGGQYVENLTIERVKIHGGARSIPHPTIPGAYLINNNGNGMYLANVRGGRVVNCLTEDTEDDGIALIWETNDLSDAPRDVTIIDCRSYRILHTGSNFVLVGRNVKLIGCYGTGSDGAFAETGSANGGIRAMYSLSQNDATAIPLSDALIQGCTIEGGQIGALIRAARTQVKDNEFRNTGGSGVVAHAAAHPALGDAGWLDISGNHVYGAGESAYHLMDMGTGKRRIRFEGNTGVGANGHGLRIQPTALDVLKVRGFAFEGAAQDGVSWHGDGTVGRAELVDIDASRNGKSGIHVKPTGSVGRLTIRRSQTHENGQYGLKVEAGQYGALSVPADDNEASGNGLSQLAVAKQPKAK